MTDKERFCELLKGTGRLGVEKVIAGLDELGFFLFMEEQERKENEQQEESSNGEG